MFVEHGDTEPSEYMYEVGNINNLDEVRNCHEYSLEFQYHDVAWVRYLNETVGNGLPAWRGKLYNFFMFNTIENDRVVLNEKLMEKYNNDTIPPMYMKHILERHSIYKRIDAVLAFESNKNIIKSNICIRGRNANDKDIENLRKSIIDKIYSVNLNDVEEDLKKRVNRKLNPEFTNDELDFIKWIDKLDDSEDHYPAEMTNLQIMKAIKEAYENAYKTGKSDNGQINKDKRIDEKFAPTKGNLYYRGKTTSKPFLLIEFQYDRDLQVITTAYPIETNKNTNKKRQN